MCPVRRPARRTGIVEPDLRAGTSGTPKTPTGRPGSLGPFADQVELQYGTTEVSAGSIRAAAEHAVAPGIDCGAMTLIGIAGPDGTTGPASPSTSATHCGVESPPGARWTRMANWPVTTARVT
jgi:hypothetical protein